MTTMQTNGKLRKSLADQIDRLDTILDGLAEALNESVAAAVQQAVSLAVREAVQAVLTEVLANPEMLRRLRASAPVPADQPIPVPLDGLRGLCRWLRCKVAAAAARAGAAVRLACAGLKRAVGQGWAGACHHARGACQGARAVLQVGWLRTLALFYLARQLRRPVLVALAVGVVTGTGCFLAGPVAASIASGMSSMTSAFLVMTLRSLLGTPLSAPSDPGCLR